MPKPTPAVEHAMEAQVRLRQLRSETHPLWEAAIATGNWELISEVKAFAMNLRALNRQAQRIAAIADHPGVCADGLFEPGHGKAA